MSVSKRKSQPYQMKGVDALFGEQPITAAEFVPRQKIDLPPQQPRRYFEPQAMQKLVESVKRHGILAPLLVRRSENDRYELVAGERRYRAATEAGLDEIPVVIQELTDEEAFELALLENLQREDLNTVEETEAILELLARKLNLSQEAAITLLNQAAHPERDSVDNVIHSKEWKKVQEVFVSLGKFTPESFRTNRLPLLNLPDDILKPLREGIIAYTKARAIAKVKDDKQRHTLLEDALSQDLSLNQIKERIKQLKVDTKEQDRAEVSTLKSRIDNTCKRLKNSKQSKLLDDPKKKKRLEKLLTELESLLDGN